MFNGKETMHVDHFEWTTTQDDYEEGEIGRRQLIFSESDVGTYAGYQDMLNGLAHKFGASKNPENWYLYEGDDEIPRIEAGYLVDEENVEATPRLIDQWKKGEKNLWAATLIVEVSLGTFRKPSLEELKKLTGLKEQ